MDLSDTPQNIAKIILSLCLVVLKSNYALENRMADIKEKTSSILLTPRPYEDFLISN